MGEALAKGLIIGLFFGFIGLIRYIINWIRFKNREKLLEEDEKNSFLEYKFKHLLNTKEGKKRLQIFLFHNHLTQTSHGLFTRL